MKKILSILCVLSIVALVPACDNDNDKGGTNGTTIPEVSWDLNTTNAPVAGTSQVTWVTCFNAEKSVIANPYQTCEWYCGTYNGSPPRYHKVTFLLDDNKVDFTIESIQTGTCRL